MWPDFNLLDIAKAMWLLKRHTKEESHKIKGRWHLDDNNNTLASKPADEPKKDLKPYRIIQELSRKF